MKAFFCAWLFVVSSLALAQSSRTDALYKLDQTSIQVKIDELTDTDVIYIDPAAPKVKKSIARSQVWKIVFRDGSTETITPLADKTADTDQITLIDQTTVRGKVIRRDERKLYFTKPADPTHTQYELLLSRLDRIQYATGKDELFSKTGGSTTLGGQADARTERAADAVSVIDNEPPAASASYSDPAAFSRIHLTVGPEVSLFSQGSSSRWSNALSGLGMNQSIGASLRIDYRFIRAIAVSLTGGYAQWKLTRNYLQDNSEKYDETIQLARIPIQVGVKLYPWRGIYVLPEAGVNLLMSTVKTSGAHPAPTDEHSSTTPVTYGGSVGYEFRLGGLLLDVSGRYQILDVKGLNFGAIAPALTEKVQFGSLRVGIGFNAFRK